MQFDFTGKIQKYLGNFVFPALLKSVLTPIDKQVKPRFY